MSRTRLGNVYDMSIAVPMKCLMTCLLKVYEMPLKFIFNVFEIIDVSFSSHWRTVGSDFSLNSSVGISRSEILLLKKSVFFQENPTQVEGSSSTRWYSPSLSLQGWYNTGPSHHPPSEQWQFHNWQSEYRTLSWFGSELLIALSQASREWWFCGLGPLQKSLLRSLSRQL